MTRTTRTTIGITMIRRRGTAVTSRRITASTRTTTTRTGAGVLTTDPLIGIPITMAPDGP